MGIIIKKTNKQGKDMSGYTLFLSIYQHNQVYFVCRQLSEIKAEFIAGI